VSVICIKYRLYPTAAQETALQKVLDLCRQVYNGMLNERKALYETTGKSPGLRQQQAALTHWKKANPDIAVVHSQVLQNVAVRIDLAFQAFFRRIRQGEEPGYPRFKSAGTYDSITFPQAPSGCKLIGDSLRVFKVGDIPCIVHRPLLGTPKTCTIRRRAGKWFVCFACEYVPELLPPSTEMVGIDVGIEKFAALSDGTFVENPRFFRKDEQALAKAQRKQARYPSKTGEKKGTPARKKANKVVARIHERIRNRRHNFLHQLARQLVNRFGIIAVENLHVKNMSARPKKKEDEAGNPAQNGASRKAGLNKSILDAAWSQFRCVLSLKAESAAREIIEVNPAFTSQDCCACGHRAKKALKERWHHCPMCGLSLDRDTNAAFNILQRAKPAAKSAVGLHSVASALA
jgi:putative transposase